MLFKEYGEEGLPAILFFPEAALPAALFRPVVRALRDAGYRVIIPQYARVLPDAFHLAQEAAEYIRPLAGTFSICGTGYGASVGVELLGLCPDRFDAAMLERPVFLPEKYPTYQPKTFLRLSLPLLQEMNTARLYRALAPVEMTEEEFRKAMALLSQAIPLPSSMPDRLPDIPAMLYFPPRGGTAKIALNICQRMGHAFAQPDSRLQSISAPDKYVTEFNHLRSAGVTFREPSARMKKEKSK